MERKIAVIEIMIEDYWRALDDDMPDLYDNICDEIDNSGLSETVKEDLYRQLHKGGY